jgi:tetratricopeptide (TPR) repeat protein
MTTTSTLDVQTTDAIRQALGAASRGMHTEACQIGERALAAGGDIAALNAMLGMLYTRTGNLDRAVQHLGAAHRERPKDPIVANNLVDALVQLDRKREALEILTDELIAADRGNQLLKIRGFLAQMLDEFDLAIRSYEQVVAKEPEDCESWNNLGNARRGLEDFEGSVEALRRATDLAPDSDAIRLNFATALIQAGDWDEAEVQLRRMAADFPDDPNPLRELHSLLKQEGRDNEALEAVEAAIERAPEDIGLLLGLASHLSYMLNSVAAEAAYRRVLKLDPDNALAYLGLAVCFDLTNRTEELAALVPQAEEQGVGSNALNFIRAYDHRRAKRFAEGLAAMEQVPSDLETARRSHLMGQLLEGVGRYDEAFESYTQMNELMINDAPRPRERAAAYRNLLQVRREAMTQEWVDRWKPEAKKDPRPAPVFLLGFPRSGTTLLDTMLMGHPSIEVLEEEPTLHKAFELFSNYEDIPVATDEQIQAARDAYFETAAARTSLKPGNLLVDKNPLATNAIPFIRRLFPDARIILALRHPCDVLLSCYVTNFRLNDGMANFVQLDTAAELYDLTFSYFERVQELMPTPTHVVSYENVVDNQDRELRELFDFLELDWHDAVLDHQSTARGRGRIKTASYAQVVEPIYKRSSGRWQNYRKHLEPIFPVIRPWVEKFGYSLDETASAGADKGR